MADVEGSRWITPQMRETYREEFSRGWILFQQSFQEYQKSEIPVQKDEFKNVMDKALHIVRETAAQCLSQEIQREALTVQNDYNSYIANPSQENLGKLNKDIADLSQQL